MRSFITFLLFPVVIPLIFCMGVFGTIAECAEMSLNEIREWRDRL